MSAVLEASTSSVAGMVVTKSCVLLRYAMQDNDDLARRRERHLFLMKLDNHVPMLCDTKVPSRDADIR